MCVICDWEFGMTVSENWRESQEWSLRITKSCTSGPGGWILAKCGQNLKIIKKSPLLGRFNVVTDHCTTQHTHGRFVPTVHEPRVLRQERHHKEPLIFGACGTDAQVTAWSLEGWEGSVSVPCRACLWAQPPRGPQSGSQRASLWLVWHLCFTP